MKRWHEEITVAMRHRMLHSQFAHGGRPTGCACDEQLGPFRKSRGMGCGRPKCQVCHYEKVHGIEMYRDRMADERFREQLADE